MPPKESSMNFQQSKPKKSTLKGVLNTGLKFRIIIPFFILISLIILVLAMFSIGSSQFSFELLFISIVALLATVGLGLFLADQIDKRIIDIIEAAEKVTQGDLSVRLNDNHYDQIGRFSHVFNQMIANLDHLYHSRDLLSRTMSPTVRQSLIEKGLDFRGITQEVSILFVDIRGFTRITEVHNTEQVDW
jgi:adenylate cyclase